MADLFLKVTCINCQEDVNDISIQCCECEDFDICLECFAAGAEIGNHKKDHSYVIRDTCASKKLLEVVSKWTASEHYMLLNGMEYYRYGSWEKISEHVKSRLPEEVKSEYDRVFLEGTIGVMTWSTPDVTAARPSYTIDFETAMKAIAPPATSKLHPILANSDEMEKLGYSPFRDEYKLEYNHDIEQLIPMLIPHSPDDSKFEKIFKILVIDIIHRRLIDRIRRKRFVRDYQLITKFFKQIDKNNKQSVPDEHEILSKKFQVFSRVQTSNEFDNFINSIIILDKLKKRRDQIINYRNKGFMTRDEVIHYEEHVLYNNQEHCSKNPCSVTHLIYFANVWKEKKREKESNLCKRNYMDVVFSSSHVTDDNIRSMTAYEYLNEFDIFMCKIFGLKPLQLIKLKFFILKGAENSQIEHIVQNKFTCVMVDKTLKEVVSDYLKCSSKHRRFLK